MTVCPHARLIRRHFTVFLEGFPYDGACGNTQTYTGAPPRVAAQPPYQRQRSCCLDLTFRAPIGSLASPRLELNALTCPDQQLFRLSRRLQADEDVVTYTDARTQAHRRSSRRCGAAGTPLAECRADDVQVRSFPLLS
jgi:hypothetical protein